MSELPWTLTESEIASFEEYASEHGLAALLDHLGLDELANEVLEVAVAAAVLCNAHGWSYGGPKTLRALAAEVALSRQKTEAQA